MAKNKKNKKNISKTSDNTENVYLISYLVWSRPLTTSPGPYKYEVKTKEVVARNRYEAYKNSGVTSILNIIPLFGD